LKADEFAEQVGELGSSMETEVDKVFSKFCKKINVANVSMYGFVLTYMVLHVQSCATSSMLT
jgi:hypothetical protein